MPFLVQQFSTLERSSYSVANRFIFQYKRIRSIGREKEMETRRGKAQALTLDVSVTYFLPTGAD